MYYIYIYKYNYIYFPFLVSGSSYDMKLKLLPVVTPLKGMTIDHYVKLSM